MPSAFQEELLAAVNGLVDSIECPPPSVTVDNGGDEVEPAKKGERGKQKGGKGKKGRGKGK